MINIYKSVIDQNEDLIQECMKNIPGFPAVSMDSTYNIGKRTIVTDSKTKQQSSITNNCWFSIMSGLNQLVYCADAKAETLENIYQGLDKLFEKEVKPKYICVDNCCSVGEGIQADCSASEV